MCATHKHRRAQSRNHYERGQISPATISAQQSTQLDECVPRTNIVGPSLETTTNGARSALQLSPRSKTRNWTNVYIAQRCCKHFGITTQSTRFFPFRQECRFSKELAPEPIKTGTVTSATSVRCPTQVLFPFSARDSMEPSLETATNGAGSALQLSPCTKARNWTNVCHAQTSSGPV